MYGMAGMADLRDASTTAGRSYRAIPFALDVLVQVS